MPAIALKYGFMEWKVAGPILKIKAAKGI